MLGKPEYGYAIGHEYPGEGDATDLGSEVVLRAGSIVYAGRRLGEQTTIGHHTTLRSYVSVGVRSQLAHRMSVERGCRIGDGVRCSPGSHITSGVVMEGGVFIGAGVVTVNDKGMIWRDPHRSTRAISAIFRAGCQDRVWCQHCRRRAYRARGARGHRICRDARHPCICSCLRRSSTSTRADRESTDWLPGAGRDVKNITAFEWLDEAVGPIDDHVLGLLHELDHLLTAAASRRERGFELRDFRRVLCERGFGGIDVPKHAGGSGLRSHEQLLIQVLCGWHDADFRDVAHVGHGNLLLRHGSPEQQVIWTPRILEGALVAIAATERQGGSNIRRISTVLSNLADRLVIRGEKAFVSRIEEADVFVVFCRNDTNGALAAVCVPADAAGLDRQPERPEGLDGWSWGTLGFDDVSVESSDVLPGNGIAIFSAHFAYYRPLVAATVVGAAARVWQQAADDLQRRCVDGHIDRVRDSVLERLAAAHIALQGALLSAVRAVELVERGDPRAQIWSRSTKAHCVETAHNAAEDAARLLGARGFRAGSIAAKALRDIRAYLYADGMHDALLRSAGRDLLGMTD